MFNFISRIWHAFLKLIGFKNKRGFLADDEVLIKLKEALLTGTFKMNLRMLKQHPKPFPLEFMTKAWETEGLNEGENLDVLERKLTDADKVEIQKLLDSEIRSFRGNKFGIPGTFRSTPPRFRSFRSQKHEIFSRLREIQDYYDQDIFSWNTPPELPITVHSLRTLLALEWEGLLKITSIKGYEWRPWNLSSKMYLNDAVFTETKQIGVEVEMKPHDAK